METHHVLGLCLVLATLCAAWTYTDCGTDGAKIIGVGVSPCNPIDVNGDDDACVMYPGMNCTIRILFTSRIDVTNMTANVSLQFFGKSFDLPEARVCDKIGCPVLKGDKRDLKMKIRCDPSYPKEQMRLRWEVVDEKKRDVFCVMIPFKIKNNGLTKIKRLSKR